MCARIIGCTCVLVCPYLTSTISSHTAQYSYFQMTQNTETFCVKCREIKLISRRILAEGSPSYREMHDCISAIRNLIDNSPQMNPQNSKFYSYENTVLAGIEISYFRSKSGDFISAGTLAYSQDVHTRRTAAIDPVVAWDYLSASLAMVALTLTQSCELKIQNLRHKCHVLFDHTPPHIPTLHPHYS